jgi:DNA-binding GntR family transcriptional regulator
MKTRESVNDTYTTLFDRIIHGVYPANTRLKEDELAEEFKVSRTPIRETLRLLQQDGLIEILPNRGARVYGFTVDDLEDLYEIRRVLEVLALDFAASSMSISGLVELRESIEAIKDLDDAKKHAELDAKLHGYIIESSRRRRLISMLNQLFHLLQTFRELGFRDMQVQKSTYGEHLELIDALSVRDISRAKEVLARHITNSKNRILQKVVNRS